MNKNFNLDELESFLSESADEHRMYPSDRVWRNIDSELHEKKRWPALTFFSILFGAVITAGLILIQPDKNMFTINIPQAQATSQAFVNESGQVNGTESHLQTKQTAANLPIRTPYRSVHHTNNAPFDFADIGNDEEFVVYEQAPVSASITQFEDEIIAITTYSNGSSKQTGKPIKQSLQKSTVPEVIEAQENILGAAAAYSMVEMAAMDYPNVKTPLVMVATNMLHASNSKNAISKRSNIFAIAKLTPAQRWAVSFYATPSHSYRILKEVKKEDKTLPAPAPVAPNLTQDVNDFVRHKPLTGLEVGAGVVYSVTQKFRVKVGLQVNYRQYGIDAFASSFESTTILLNQGGSAFDSLNGYTTISNRSGAKPINLTNKYWQIAIPFGFDMKLTKGKKLNVYVGGSIQPTYQVNKQNIYLLTSDYKNYVQEPELIRRWNINTSIETFLNYKVSKSVNMQLGPQIRYQMLPGSIDQYPIRENLIDYGVKLGIVKTIK